MLLTLEKTRLISRHPGAARSIAVQVDRADTCPRSIPDTLKQSKPLCRSTTPVLSSTRWTGPALAGTRGCRPANARPRRLDVLWSGADNDSSSNRSTLQANASACRRAKWNMSRNVSTNSIARSEYSACPPGLLRFGAAQPVSAASSSHSGRSPRRGGLPQRPASLRRGSRRAECDGRGRPYA